jgi:Tol biopolymer transport system component
MIRPWRVRRVTWCVAGLLVAAIGLGCQADIVYVGTFGSGLALYVMDEASGATRLLTAGPVDTAPAWSPDGTRIAFVRWVGDAPDIFVVGADGANLVRLTDNPGQDFAPTWSPDGSTIAFLSERDGALSAYLMDADGADQRSFVGLPGDVASLDWSPDGASIAFDRIVNYEHHVFILDVLSAKVRALIEPPGAEPCWSPDGEWIAFSGDAQIGIVRPDGTGLRWVTAQGGRNVHPTWSPDGTRIAYQSDDLERNTVCVVSLSTGTYFRVADLGTSPDWSPGL